MLEINAAFGQEGKNLGLVGRTGENASRRIVFDCESVLGEFPDAGIVCALRRACDAEAYAKELTAEGKKRLLTLSAADVAAPGSLMIELRAVEADAVRKSAVYVGRVERGLSGQGDAPGNPVADTINNLEARAKAASAAASAAQAVANEVQAKLEAGEFKGDKGDPGKDGSDADVTAENVEKALGYKPVSVVRVNGASVVADGAADVPIASEAAAGVVKSNSWGGTCMDSNGRMVLFTSTQTHIDARTSSTAIVPTNLDMAVKAAMTDGKGAAWTAAEQQAARERMGIDKPFELIEEITTDGETIVERTLEPDGTPYDFKKIMVVVTAPKQMEASVTGYAQISAGNTALSSYLGFPANQAYFRRGLYAAEVKNGMLEYRSVESAIVYSATQGGGSGDASAMYQSVTPCFVSANITKVRCFGYNTTALPAGFLIQIYGVRA